MFVLLLMLFRPLYCMSFFDLQLLITSLVSSIFFLKLCSFNNSDLHKTLHQIVVLHSSSV